MGIVKIMQLEVQTLWSPDLDPPSEGRPPDLFNFDIFIQISIGEIGKPGKEVFDCRVCSVSALQNTKSGHFISHTLILDKFDWTAIKDRINKLLLHTSSCKNWDDVITKLSACIRYSDS